MDAVDELYEGIDAKALVRVAASLHATAAYSAFVHDLYEAHVARECAKDFAVACAE